MSLTISTTSGGPTLVNGAFTVSFPQFEKVYNAIAVAQGVAVAGGAANNVSGLIFSISTLCSGASVAVHFSQQAVDGAGGVTDATTAEVSGCKVTVLADGQ